MKRWLVSGRVQGVGFRFFVHREATRLGLRGTVRNSPDGTVEVIASGNAETLEELVAKLHEGPEMSDVTAVEDVSSDGLDDEIGETFEIVG